MKYKIMSKIIELSPSPPARWGLAVVLGLLQIIAAPTLARAADALVFAAASTTNAINEIAKVAASQGLPKIVPSYGSSSTLAKQIANGAPAHIFVSANVKWMDFLDEKKLIEKRTRVDLIGNSLVLIAPAQGRLAKMPATGELTKDYPLLANLAGGKLAMGDPAHVPAGLYGKKALANLGLWNPVERSVASTADVRAALVLVERGEAEAGVVYSTDAAILAGKVKVIGTFPESSHERIIYPSAIVAGRASADAEKIYALLVSKKAAEIFQRYGFKPIAAP